MRGAWIIVVGLAPFFVTGCLTSRSLARKERLPNSSLGAGTVAAGPSGVDSVLRDDQESASEAVSLSGATPIPTAMAVSERENAAQSGAPSARESGNALAPSSKVDTDMNASGNRLVGASSPVSTNSADRMRTIAQRLKRSSPEQLGEFMKEAHEGSAKGNLESVLASWEVSLEFLDDSSPHSPTADQRSNSLSASLKKRVSESSITDTSTTTADLPVSREREARVVSVAASVSNDDNTPPPALQQPLSPSQGLRRLPYRGEDSTSSENRPRAKSSHDVDFASWAEYAEEQSKDKREIPPDGRFMADCCTPWREIPTEPWSRSRVLMRPIAAFGGATFML